MEVKILNKTNEHSRYPYTPGTILTLNIVTDTLPSRRRNPFQDGPNKFLIIDTLAPPTHSVVLLAELLNSEKFDSFKLSFSDRLSSFSSRRRVVLKIYDPFHSAKLRTEESMTPVNRQDVRDYLTYAGCDSSSSQSSPKASVEFDYGSARDFLHFLRKRDEIIEAGRLGNNISNSNYSGQYPFFPSEEGSTTLCPTVCSSSISMMTTTATMKKSFSRPEMHRREDYLPDYSVTETEYFCPSLKQKFDMHPDRHINETTILAARTTEDHSSNPLETWQKAWTRAQNETYLFHKASCRFWNEKELYFRLRHLQGSRIPMCYGKAALPIRFPSLYLGSWSDWKAAKRARRQKKLWDPRAWVTGAAGGLIERGIKNRKEQGGGKRIANGELMSVKALVLEYVEGFGMDNLNTRVPRCLFRQLVNEALDTVYEMGMRYDIVHTALSPRNFIVTREKDGKYRIVMINFSKSKKIGEHELTKSFRLQNLRQHEERLRNDLHPFVCYYLQKERSREGHYSKEDVKGSENKREK